MAFDRPEKGEALARYIAANPGMTARDFKGKGFTEFAPFDKHYVGPNEQPWDKLDRDEVRQAAIQRKARFLSRGERMAAARDPWLIWDERSRSYRRRLPSDPRPLSLPADKAREGVSKDNHIGSFLPEAATEKIANMEIGSPRGRARGHQGGSS